MNTDLFSDLVLRRLLESDEPSIRYKAVTGILGAAPDSAEAKALREEIRSSSLATSILSKQLHKGSTSRDPYSTLKVLASLADIGYPLGDKRLIPMRELVFEWLLSEHYPSVIGTIAGRVRVHDATKEGRALHAMLALGLADERTEELTRRLQSWQWPDGGWNDNRMWDVVDSSYYQSFIPMRAFALHAQITGNEESKQAANRATQFLLERHLFRGLPHDTFMPEIFAHLHFPPYWNYDVLSALLVITEVGYARDPRCKDALDQLELKQLPDGTFAAEFYRTHPSASTGRPTVDWGLIDRTTMNEFVTVEALTVLKAAGRLELPT